MKIEDVVDVTINLEKQADKLGLNRISVVTQCPSCSSAQECTSNDYGQFGAVSCPACGIEYGVMENTCTLSKPSNHSSLLSGIQGGNASEYCDISKSDLDALTSPPERSISPHWHWPDNTEFTARDPELSTNQTTHTAAFEFPNGEVIELPEPGGVWTAGETHDYKWPHRHAEGFISHGSDNYRFAISNGMVFPIEHKNGQCILHEYGKRIHDEQARVLWVKEWTMPNVTFEVDETMIPEKDPVFEGGWPVRHSNGPIKVND